VSRTKRAMLTIAFLFCAADTCWRDTVADDAELFDVADLRIRDPFVVTDFPNARYNSPKERARFFEVREEQDTVRLQAVGWQENHD